MDLEVIIYQDEDSFFISECPSIPCYPFFTLTFSSPPFIFSYGTLHLKSTFFAA